ncbi:MAG: protein kinase [Candidatus Aminicenantes bacterium]|nr:protein kinase [Candidatus Aminicenantes bacterium]
MGLSGSRIRHYQILRQLGKGGMGEVWLAHDTVLDRQVAIKFLPENLQTDPLTRERFLREAKAAAALDHPFICKIFETGESGGRTYIVMEYMEGCNLQDKMKEAEISARDALQIALEVAEALEVAHAKGIVHRDLKPANIMCTPQGHAKVMDFGIAKRILPGPESVQATLTQMEVTAQGTIIGTIDYMSPEQAKGAPVDGRSDIFSLGVILYEMLSGKHPFAKLTPIETLTSVLKDPVPSFVVKPKNINPVAHHIIKKCLAKKPEDRYANIKEFSAEVRKAKDEIVGRLPFFLRGWWAAATAAIVLVLAGLAIWRFVLGPKGPSSKPAVEPVSVLLADVQNKTGDPIFDGVLEKVIGISLDGVPYISLYDTKQARQQAAFIKPNAGGRIDMETAQLLCRSAGINAVVSASIESIPSGGGFVVKMWALDPANAKLAEVEQPIKTKNDFLKVADYLAVQLRDQLVKIPEESKETLIRETFTTTSLEAVKAYANAQELEAQGKPDEAIKEYLRTIDNDTSFGRAYSGLAAIYYNRGDQQKAEEYYLKALKNIDRMTDREKYRTRGGYYLCTFNFANAVEQYSALVKNFPNDSAGHSMLAFAYFLGRNTAKAYEEGGNALKLNPHHINTRYNFCWFALAAGQFERAGQEAKILIDSNPKFEESYILAALAEFTQGRTARAEEFFHQLEALGPSGKTLARTGLADLALYEGRTAEALSILEAGIPFDIENDRKDIAALKAVMLGQTFDALGKKDQAVKYADRAVQLSEQGNILFCAGEIYLHAGKEDKARELQAKLGKLIEPENQAYAKLLGGASSLARGDAVNAINLFKEAQKHADSWLGRLSLGKAYLQARAFAEAQAEFENCLKRRGEATSVFFNDLPSWSYFPQVYYYLGQAQEGIGSAGAKASYETFLKIKEKADAGDPMVEEARKRLNSR